MNQNPSDQWAQHLDEASAGATAVLMGPVFVVVAIHGEYSDREEWSVCYFLREADAQGYVAALAERIRLWSATGKQYLRSKGIDPSSNWEPDYIVAVEEWWQGWELGTDAPRWARLCEDTYSELSGLNLYVTEVVPGPIKSRSNR